MSTSRSDFPRVGASSVWQVLESRQTSRRDNPGSIAALIAVAAIIALFYLIYV